MGKKDNSKHSNEIDRIELNQDDNIKAKSKKILTKKDKIFLIVQGVLAFICVVMMIVAGAVSRSTQKSEQWARTVSRSFSTFFGNITNAFSFSVFETMCFILVLTALVLIIFSIVFFCKKKIKKGVFLIKNLLIIALVFVSLYVFAVSPCYNREPLDIPQYQGEIDKDGVLEFADKYIEKLNALAGQVYRENDLLVNPYTKDELQEIINQSCAKVDTDYYNDHTSRIKYITNSNIMSKAYIEGITFLPLGEANINKRIQTISQVMTSLHEICHAKGVMREGDCNLYSYYVAMSSDNPYIQYCGYADNLYSVLNLVSVVTQTSNNNEIVEDDTTEKKETVYTQYYNKVDARVYKDIDEDRKVWNDVGASFFSKIGSFFNDLYLKINGQKDGTGSYHVGFESEKTDNVTEDGFVEVIITLSEKERLFIALVNQLN